MRGIRKDTGLIVGPILRYFGGDAMTVVWETQGEVAGEVVYGPIRKPPDQTGPCG